MARCSCNSLKIPYCIPHVLLIYIAYVALSDEELCKWKKISAKEVMELEYAQIGLQADS